MRQKLAATPVPIQIPIGAENRYSSIAIDLVAMEQVSFGGKQGELAVRSPIPPNLLADAKAAHDRMIESLADLDDEVAASYLEGKEVPIEKVREVLRKGTIANRIQPVVCGSALRDKGVVLLLDAIVDYLPSPLDIPQ